MYPIDFIALLLHELFPIVVVTIRFVTTLFRKFTCFYFTSEKNFCYARNLEMFTYGVSEL